jgi:hypothetical protein
MLSRIDEGTRFSCLGLNIWLLWYTHVLKGIKGVCISRRSLCVSMHKVGLSSLMLWYLKHKL